MSLINEALKKAQRQRSLDTAPLSSAPSGIAAAAVTTHVRAASHKRSHGALWFGLGLVTLGAAATVLVMRYGFDTTPAQPTTSAPVKPLASVPTPAAASAHSMPALAATVVEPVPAAPMVVLPAIPGAKPSPSLTPAPAPSPQVVPVAATSVQETKPASTPGASSPAAGPIAIPIAPTVPAPATPAAVAAVQPTQSAQPASAEAVSPAVPAPVVPVAAVLTPAEREAKIYAFLTSLRLTGVRGVDRDARVLMNERVWRLNDTVSPELGLRLSAIRPNLLVFTDAQGKTFEKPY